MNNNTALFQYCLRLGDTNLILGHRLSEMCSRAPFLEEDIALSNLALDHIGQAEALLKYAGEVEGAGRSEDDLAYLRPEWEYRNLILAEMPNVDFAWVIVRQYLIDVYQCLLYEQLSGANDATLAAMGARFLKEAIYHRRHSSTWMARLGKGTAESHRRMQNALNELWKYTVECFEPHAEESLLTAAGVLPDMSVCRASWEMQVHATLDQAGLQLPSSTAPGSFVSGKHTEHLGHMLAEMQYLQRAFPGASW